MTGYQTWLEDCGEKLAENGQRVSAFILSGLTFRSTGFKIIPCGMAVICYPVKYWDSEDGGSSFVRNVENTSHCHIVQKFKQDRYWWYDADRGNRSSRRKTCRRGPLKISCGLGLNPSLRAEGPVIHRLNHGTASRRRFAI
jgi:hypothetical protein